MKYKVDYFSTKTREEYYVYMKRKYGSFKKKTIQNIFSECKRRFGPQVQSIVIDNGPKFLEEHKVKPSMIKMLEVKDMKRLGFPITRTFLRIHNFHEFEINWLEENGGF